MPVDMVAGLASGELMLCAHGPWFKAVGHLSLRNLHQLSSAGKAQGPRPQGRPEPLDDIGQLVVGVLPAHESCAAQCPTHQQAPISAEQNAVLTSGPPPQTRTTRAPSAQRV